MICKHGLVKKCMALGIAVCLLCLVSCDETEPLPDGVSSLPDIDASSFAEADGTLHWPSELLPADFPEATYTEIHSVERVDNEVRIVLFAHKKTGMYSTDKDFLMKITESGYVYDTDWATGTTRIVNRDGFVVTISSSEDNDTHLTAINEKSPTGFTYELRVRQEEAPPEAYFWTYPSADTDLGLEEKTFTEWPSDALPDAFPRPGDGTEILSMQQKPTGVFLTVRDDGTYLQTLQEAGFQQLGPDGTKAYVSENGDYVYLSFGQLSDEGDTYTIPYTVQVCRRNAQVKQE